MRKEIPLILLLLAGGVEALELGANVLIGSGTAGYYNNSVAVTMTGIVINTTHVKFTGLNAESDGWDYTNKVGLFFDEATAIIVDVGTNADMEISQYFFNEIHGGTITSAANNFTTMTIVFDNTATSNYSVNMLNQSGTCNYRASNSSSVIFPRSASGIANCTVTVGTNATTGSLQMVIDLDSEMSTANLAGIIVTATVAITSIIVRSYWTTETSV